MGIVPEKKYYSGPPNFQNELISEYLNHKKVEE